MIRSMTGYGEAEGKFGGTTVRVEVAALNGKFLTIDPDIPARLERFRTDLEKLVRSRLSRGVLRLKIRIPEVDGNTYEVDGECFERYLKGISETAKRLGTAGEIDPAAVAALPGVIRRKESVPATQEQWDETASVVESALTDLEEDRAREGACMAEELGKILSSIAGGMKEIKDLLPGADNVRYDRYADRIKKTAGDLVSEDVIAREAALISERHDISEELHRLETHIAEFSRLLERGGAAGRKLEFLSQEMHRESVTMCSKADDPEVSHISMEIRANIQRIKELTLNVE